MALPRKTLLILSQTFVPDPAAVGQCMADVAFEMARRGHKVRVYASDSGYEDPSRKYVRRERLKGAEIRRLPWTSFGKGNLKIRAFGTFMFMLQCLILGLWTPNLGGIFFSTSPPLIGIIAAIIGRIRRVPIAYWAMDLNPDQLVAMGKLRPSDLTTRSLEAINRIILHESRLIIGLDRFMAERLQRRSKLSGKLLVMPPWAHEEHLGLLPHENNPFRAKHGLTDKFVIMYSGNHSPANPLKTLLEATVQMKDDPQLRFLFIGGGLGKKEVETHIQGHKLNNVLSLPYQPLGELRFSLSAADVHVVSLGAEMVGIIHPCKIYGAMSVAKPILYLGPRPSHITDILDGNAIGEAVAHGDVEGCVRAIRRLQTLPSNQLGEMGSRAQQHLSKSLSQALLTKRFCDRLEIAVAL
jgi:colanic acid biosynthesis glycosyl transferase WcaI